MAANTTRRRRWNRETALPNESKAGVNALVNASSEGSEGNKEIVSVRLIPSLNDYGTDKEVRRLLKALREIDELELKLEVVAEAGGRLCRNHMQKIARKQEYLEKLKELELAIPAPVSTMTNVKLEPVVVQEVAKAKTDPSPPLFQDPCLVGEGEGDESRTSEPGHAHDVDASRVLRKMNKSGWPDLPHCIEGRGRYCGKAPRSAGVIAICMIQNQPHVCICEKKNGKASFPKGGLHHGETILIGAQREWSEEAGLSLSRLHLLYGASFDEPGIGCRYVAARCDPPCLQSTEPDVNANVWKPPHEDPTDTDPIVKSQWLPVAKVLQGCVNLNKDRRNMLQQAVEQLNIGREFVPWCRI
jgi:8-oxo-dGTP pyrophosphatase MutT (NUDIX family)